MIVALNEVFKYIILFYLSFLPRRGIGEEMGNAMIDQCVINNNYVRLTLILFIFLIIFYFQAEIVFLLASYQGCGIVFARSGS